MTGTPGLSSPDVLVDRIVAHAWTEARSTSWSPVRSGRRMATFAAEDVASLSKARAALSSAPAERSMTELKRAFATLTVAIGTAQEHHRSHAS